tara:strand:+ start:1287 stop:2006 length:720 start_codon:yes stop_codon:yes gene_type:complete
MIYIINDIFDKDFDLAHPNKSKRPIASGAISIHRSLLIGSIHLLIGLIIISRESADGLFLTIVYLIINFLYSYKLKQIPIIDFMIIASGFVIRLTIGSVACNIFLSNWIILLVFLLSLFIAITKRRDDVHQYEAFQKLNRAVVIKYNVDFMDKSITIISSVLIVTYILFTTSNEVIERYQTNLLYLTLVPVLIGLLRYNQITYVYGESGSPIKILFRDLFLQIIVFFWVVLFFVIIYAL